MTEQLVKIGDFFGTIQWPEIFEVLSDALFGILLPLFCLAGAAANAIHCRVLCDRVTYSHTPYVYLTVLAGAHSFALVVQAVDDFLVTIIKLGRHEVPFLFWLCEDYLSMISRCLLAIIAGEMYFITTASSFKRSVTQKVLYQEEEQRRARYVIGSGALYTGLFEVPRMYVWLQWLYAVTGEMWFISIICAVFSLTCLITSITFQLLLLTNYHFTRIRDVVAPIAMAAFMDTVQFAYLVFNPISIESFWRILIPEVEADEEAHNGDNLLTSTLEPTNETAVVDYHIQQHQTAWLWVRLFLAAECCSIVIFFHYLNKNNYRSNFVRAMLPRYCTTPRGRLFSLFHKSGYHPPRSSRDLRPLSFDNKAMIDELVQEPGQHHHYHPHRQSSAATLMGAPLPPPIIVDISGERSLTATPTSASNVTNNENLLSVPHSFTDGNSSNTNSPSINMSSVFMMDDQSPTPPSVHSSQNSHSAYFY